MTRTDSSAIDHAHERMLADEGTEGWVQSAADYWTLLHPELARFRRGNPARTPTVEEMRDRAQAVRDSMRGVPKAWQLAPPSAERTEHRARVGWFHETMAGLYEPIWHAQERLRSGDGAGTEALIRFLEAEVFCFRSGYKKADVIRDLIRAELDEQALVRLRNVVLAATDGFDRREFRAYVRLARRVDSDGLRRDLEVRASSGMQVVARHARWILDGLLASTA